MKVVCSGSGYISPEILNTFLTGFMTPWTHFQPTLKKVSHTKSKSADVFTTQALPTPKSTPHTLKRSLTIQAIPLFKSPVLISTPRTPSIDLPVPKKTLSLSQPSMTHQSGEQLQTIQTPQHTEHYQQQHPPQHSLEQLALQVNQRLHQNSPTTHDGIYNYLPIAQNRDTRTTLMIRNIPNK
jgi:hypothetical protein